MDQKRQVSQVTPQYSVPKCKDYLTYLPELLFFLFSFRVD